MVATLSSTVGDFLSTPMATFERYADDTAGVGGPLVMGFIAPVVLSFVWMGVLRYFTGLFAYLIIFMVDAMAIVCTLYLYMKADVIGSDQVTAYVGTSMGENLEGYTDPSEDNQEVMKYCAHVALAITIVLFLFTLLMLKRVRTAVAVIKVAAGHRPDAPKRAFFPPRAGGCVAALRRVVDRRRDLHLLVGRDKAADVHVETRTSSDEVLR